jgi:hypothetical protein
MSDTPGSHAHSLRENRPDRASTDGPLSFFDDGILMRVIPNIDHYL